LYSSFSCEFLQVNVGFNPSNVGWNQSTVNIGIFFFESESLDEEFGDNVVEGCVRFSDSFEQQFIKGDKTWTATQIMALVAAISGMIATVVAWLMVVTPIPACFIWPGVVLPAVMLAFLAEGSKFLFFDVSICRSSIWYPSGAESMPQPARSCTMGITGAFIISSSVVFFIGLVMVCLKAPKLRMLKENYGESYRDNFMASAQQLHSESFTDDPEAQIAVANLDTLPDQEEEDGASLHGANTSMVMSMSSQEDSTIDGERGDPLTDSFVSNPGSESFQAQSADEFSTFPLKRRVSDDEAESDMVFDSEFMNLSSVSGAKAFAGVRDAVIDPPDTELQALAPRISQEPDRRLSSLAARVSERSTSSHVEQSGSDDLIGKCVNELRESFLEDSS
jgi:hypothetical protein